MKTDFTIQDYVDNDMSIAHGAVVYGDPNQNWKSVWNESKQLFELQKQNPDIPDAPILDQLYLSKGINYPELAQFVFGTPQNTPLGHIEKTYLTQSSNYERNNAASSGGMIKETLRYLFKTNQITSVITIQKTGKLLYEPVKINSIEEIDQLPPSIYHMIDTTKTIELLLQADPTEKIVVVGTPWQIDDMYLYIKYVQPELKERIFLTIGLLTGWYFNQHNIKALCSYYEVPYDDLDDIRYRGYGKKGMIRFFDSQKNLIKEVSRFNTFSAATSEVFYNIPMYLLYVNTQNMLADIVVGDPHLPECGFSKTGINLTLARTSKAQSIIEKMTSSDYIHSVPIDNSALERSQRRARLYGDFAYPYAEYLKEKGIPVPHFITLSKEHIQPISRKELDSFDKKYQKRISLQRSLQFDVILKNHIWDQKITSLKKFISPSYFMYRAKIYFKKRSGADEHLKGFN